MTGFVVQGHIFEAAQLFSTLLKIKKYFEQQISILEWF